MLDTVVISGEDVVVCCLLHWLVCFCSVLCDLSCWSAISCPLWSSVYECQRVKCAFTSPVRTDCGMFVILFVCLCQLFCSAWMCCLEEVYRCW